MPHIDISNSVYSLETLKGKLDLAASRIVRKGLEKMQETTRASAEAIFAGDPENSTDPPGTLAASIVIKGPIGADGFYWGRVGPTMVYSRQRELGGNIYPGKTARSIGAIDHPRGTGRQSGSTYLYFRINGRFRRAKHVYQGPSGYMKAGYEVGLPEVEAIAVKYIEFAVLGYGFGV